MLQLGGEQELNLVLDHLIGCVNSQMWGRMLVFGVSG